MRTVRWLLVVVLALALCAGVGETKGRRHAAKRPPGTALVAEVEAVRDGGALLVVGGRMPGRGWVGGADAKGPMHAGDRLSLYTLRKGLVGSAHLADNGFNLSAWDRHGSDHQSWDGLGYHARLRFTRMKPQAHAGERAFAIWHAPGTPQPRWIRAEVLDPRHRVYRAAILDWLRARGVAVHPERGVLEVSQLLRADMNRDGVEEVLVVFDWYEYPISNTSKSESGVFMRYLPQGAEKPQVIPVLQRADYHAVLGLCDLDGDGWAEVLADHAGQECGGTCLCHWTGRGFSYVTGYSSGE